MAITGRSFPSRHVGLYMPFSGSNVMTDSGTVLFTITPATNEQFWQIIPYKDTATRNIAVGWDVPDIGSPYWVNTPITGDDTWLNVNGTQLRAVPPNASGWYKVMQYTSLNVSTNTELKGDIILPVLPAGANVNEVWINVRDYGADSEDPTLQSFYSLRILFKSDGSWTYVFYVTVSDTVLQAVNAVFPFWAGTYTYTAGSTMKFKFHVLGDPPLLRAKIWDGAGSEPTDWMKEIIDGDIASYSEPLSGGVSLQMVSQANSFEYRFDNMQATAFLPYTEPSTTVIYVDLQPSTAQEGREGLDSATVVVAITPSAAETAQFVDTGNISYKLTPSTPQEGREGLDSATILVDLQNSSTDTAQYVESATVPVAITPTTTFEARVSTDAATAGVVLTPSSTDTAQYVEAATVGVVLTPITTSEGRESADAQTVLYDIQNSATESAQFVDADTVLVDLQNSSTETAQFVDSATVAVALTPSASESAQFVDAGTVPVALSPSAVDVPVYVESATVPVKLTPSSSEVYIPAVSDAATIIYTFTPDTASETQQFAESATVLVTITPSYLDEFPIQDAATVSVLITPLTTFEQIGQEEVLTIPYLITPETSAEGDIVYFDIEPSAVIAHGWEDAAEIYVDISGDSLEEARTSTTGLINFVLTPSYTEFAEALDAATVPLILTPFTLVERRQLANYLLVGTVRSKFIGTMKQNDLSASMHSNYVVQDFFGRWGYVWHGRGDE